MKNLAKKIHSLKKKAQLIIKRLRNKNQHINILDTKQTSIYINNNKF